MEVKEANGGTRVVGPSVGAAPPGKFLPLPGPGEQYEGRVENLTDPFELPRDFTKESLRPRGWDRFVINPESRYLSYYEVLTMCCVLYTAIVEPLKVAYLVDILQGTDTFLDVFFVMDIFVQCFCGFPEKGGGSRFPVMDFRTVFATYCRTWFAIDLIAAVPFDRFVASDQTSVVVRLPGLIKTVRLLKLKRIMRKWSSLSIGPLLKVGTVLFMWMLSAHWFACAFFMIGWYGCRGYNETWVTVYWPELAPSVRTPPLAPLCSTPSRTPAPLTPPLHRTPCSYSSCPPRASRASHGLPRLPRLPRFPRPPSPASIGRSAILRARTPTLR